MSLASGAPSRPKELSPAAEELPMLITRQSFLRGSAACLAGAVAGFSVRPLAAQQARRLKVANFYAADHSMNRALREVFIPKLESYTKGALTASIHDNSSLGSERELTEGVRIGTIEMGITGGLVSSSLPILAILELPYVFRGFEHAWETFKSPIGQDLAKEFEKLNIKALDWVGNGLRAITNSVRPINSLADCHGIRMRVPPNKVYIETAKALGFSVITTPSGEIFNALAQKVADGQENGRPQEPFRAENQMGDKQGQNQDRYGLENVCAAHAKTGCK